MMTGDSRDASPKDEASADARRAFRFAAWATSTIAVAVLFTKVYAYSSAATLFDDAFMFQRYAGNLLHGHGVSWNPSGEPTYGLTSIATVLVAVPAQLMTGGGAPALAALLTSLIPGILFLLAMGWFLHRASVASREVRLAVLMTTTVLLAVGSASTHFLSGMDTSLALAYLTTYLMLATTLERAPTPRRAVWTGIFGGLAFAVRPELAAFTVLSPLAQSFSPRAELRHSGRVMLLATIGTLIAHLVAAKLYFHSALPLPFYAKALGLYGPTIRARYRGRTLIELVTFLAHYWPLLAVVAFDLARGVRRYVRDTSMLEKAVLGTTLLFVVYEWLFVLPIMYYEQRFFYPVLPALVFLAVNSAGRLESAWPARAAAVLAMLLPVLGFAVAPVASRSAQDALAVALAPPQPARFATRDFVRTPGVQGTLFRLDAFAELPDDLVMASSEVGILGALAPNKAILDLAGLNDTALTTTGFKASRVFEGGGPDLLYFPHPDYREFIRELLTSPEIEGYELYSPSSLGSGIGVGIKRSSPHFARMKEIMGTGRVTVPPHQYDPTITRSGAAR